MNPLCAKSHYYVCHITFVYYLISTPSTAGIRKHVRVLNAIICLLNATADSELRLLNTHVASTMSTLDGSKGGPFSV